MDGRWMTPGERKRVAELHAAGLPDKRIAERLMLTIPQVCAAIRKVRIAAGLPPRVRGKFTDYGFPAQSGSNSTRHFTAKWVEPDNSNPF